MTDLTPITGDDHDEILLRRVADALGYDLAKAVSGDGDCGGHGPGQQLTHVLRLLKVEQVRMYRKGWQRIVDAETPAVPDLIFNEQNEIANLPPPQL